MPDKNVQLPDGRVVAFPDSMADADISAVLQKQFPTKQPGMKTPAGNVVRLDSGGKPEISLGTGEGTSAVDVGTSGILWAGFASEVATKLRSALSKLSYTAEGKLTPLAESVLHPTTMPENAFRKLIPEPATYPGAQLPSTSEFYENKAADLMKREAQKRVLDRQAAAEGKAISITQSPYYQQFQEAQAAAKNIPESSPFAGATSSRSSTGNVQLPEPGAAATSTTGSLPEGTATQFVGKFTKAQPSRIVSPLSPAPAASRTLVSYDRDLLVHMARGGDLNALRELIRNPGGINVAEAVPNSKYLLEATQ